MAAAAAAGSPAVTNGTSDGDSLIEGMIYPPPAIRETVDKTAAHIGKRGAEGPALEDKIRQKGATGKFSFINTDDPYHAYYQHRLQLVRSGADPAIGASSAATTAQVKEVLPDDDRPTVPKPPALEFLLDIPSMAAVDLDIIKLTALFAARMGRRFQTDLAQRESANYQFEFLQPSHSLFPFFNKLVEQYTKVLIPDVERLARIDLHAGLKSDLGRDVIEEETRRSIGKREVLKEVDERVQWEKYEFEERKKQEDEEERVRVAFAEIDWQDFVVVTTVEFTDADDMIDLPPPKTLREVQNMSLRDKRKALEAAEGKEGELDEETILAEVDEFVRQAQLSAAEADGDADGEAMDGTEMDVDGAAVSNDEEIKRKKGDEIKTVDSSGQVKIKPQGYVPRSKRAAKAATTRCQICGQQIPINELSEHVRIELLDPKWKENQKIAEANRSAASLVGTGADVSASLRGLAARRPDIFSSAGMSDADKRKAAEAEKARIAKEREAVVWDGHVASGEMTTNRFQTGANLNQQIQALHRAKGLTGDSDPNASRIGPAGPGQQAAPDLAAAYMNTQQNANMAGVSISAAPQAMNVNPNAAPMFNPYGIPYVQPGQAPLSMPMSMPMSGPPPGFPPSSFPPGMAMPPGFPSSGPPTSAPAPIASSRPAEDGPDDEPSAKRTKISKLPDGQFYSEETWLSMHPEPVTLRIQMPTYPEKPEWNCNGQVVELENVPLTSIIGSLRDKIQAKTSLPVGKQQLRNSGRILTNSNTLASLNFGDGDQLELTIKKR